MALLSHDTYLMISHWEQSRMVKLTTYKVKNGLSSGKILDLDSGGARFESRGDTGNYD
jgi:hypothetical protein